jgi:hypothetical protein
LRAGHNIRYVVPQTVAVGDNVTLSLRVKEPAEKVRIRVGNILTRAFLAVKPSQMIKLDLTSKEWQKMQNETMYLEVSCTEGRK